MIVSFSEVTKWDQCQRQYYYNFSLGLRPEQESEAISKGVNGHALLQTFYEALQAGHDKETARQLVHDRAQFLLQESRKTLNSGTLLLAWTLVDNYIRSTDFTSEAFLVETRFLIPAERLTTDPYLAGTQIGFTPDIVFKRSGDFYDVEDSKFVGRAWPQSKLDHFPQAKLYQIFLRRMGYNVTRSGIRFFHVTTGNITSHYEPYNSIEEKNLLDDFMRGVKEVVKYRSELSRPRRTMNYSTCQYCAFTKPCVMEAQGKDASKTLKYQFVKSNYDYNR